MNKQVSRAAGVDETMLASLKGHQSMRIQLRCCFRKFETLVLGTPGKLCLHPLKKDMCC